MYVSRQLANQINSEKEGNQSFEERTSAFGARKERYGVISCGGSEEYLRLPLSEQVKYLQSIAGEKECSRFRGLSFALIREKKKTLRLL